MMTEDLLRSLYPNTCQHTNGFTLEQCLENFHGEWMNTVHHLFAMMPYNGSKFDSTILHSDGGVRKFLITYDLKGFDVIIHTQNEFEGYPFGNVEGMVNWINDKEKQLLATCALVELEARLQS